METFAKVILNQDKIKFRDINAKTKDSREFLEAIKEESLQRLDYFLIPEELFSGNLP
jgi:type I restriction enzyme M protein